SNCTFYGFDVTDVNNATPAVGVSFKSGAANANPYTTGTSIAYSSSLSNLSTGLVVFTGTTLMKYIQTHGASMVDDLIDTKAIINFYQKDGTTAIPLIQSGNYILAPISQYGVDSFKVKIQLQADAADLNTPMTTGSPTL